MGVTKEPTLDSIKNVPRQIHKKNQLSRNDCGNYNDENDNNNDHAYLDENRNESHADDQEDDKLSRRIGDNSRWKRLKNRLSHNNSGEKKKSSLMTHDEKKFVLELANRILVCEDEEHIDSDEIDEENSIDLMPKTNVDSINAHLRSRKQFNVKKNDNVKEAANVNRVSFKNKSESTRDSLKKRIRNLPSIKDDDEDIQQVISESDQETMRCSDKESPVTDNSNNEDSESYSSNEREENSQIPYVDDDGNLVLPEYIELQIASDNRRPLTSWPREADYKLLYLLKKMPQSEYEKKKWKWLADRMEEFGYTNTDIRIHVSLNY